MVTVFTVMVCLVVVALSGAAVLRITLGDDPQGATAPAPPGIDGCAGPPEDQSLAPSQAGPGPDGAGGSGPGGGDAPASGTDEPGMDTMAAALVGAPADLPALLGQPYPAPSTAPGPAAPPTPIPAAPYPAPEPALDKGERPDHDDEASAEPVALRSRLRSGAVLLILLPTLGAVLALVVAATLVLLVLALQAALG